MFRMAAVFPVAEINTVKVNPPISIVAERNVREVGSIAVLSSRYINRVTSDCYFSSRSIKGNIYLNKTNWHTYSTSTI